MFTKSVERTENFPTIVSNISWVPSPSPVCYNSVSLRTWITAWSYPSIERQHSQEGFGKPGMFSINSRIFCSAIPKRSKDFWRLSLMKQTL